MYNQNKENEQMTELMDRLQENLMKIATMEERIDRWAVLLEKARIDDLLHNYANPRRLIYVNIIAGLARGLGITIGTTVVVAVLGYLLKNFITLPIIGEYIARLLDIIDFHRSQYPLGGV